MGPAWRRRLLGLVSLLLVLDDARAAGGACAGRGASCVELLPRSPLRAETAPIDGPPRVYALAHLLPETAYEVRVSYPATNPADIRITLFEDDARPPRRAARRLLNVEKLVLPASLLRSRTHGSDPSPAVLIEARAAGVHRHGPAGAFQKVVYDIVLEPAVDPWGVVPRQSLPVAALAVACVVAALALEPHARRLAWPDAERAGTRKRR